MTDDKIIKLVKSKSEFTEHEQAFIESQDRFDRVSDELLRRKRIRIEQKDPSPGWSIGIPVFSLVAVGATILLVGVLIGLMDAKAQRRCDAYETGTGRSTKLIERICFVQDRDGEWYTRDEYTAKMSRK